MVDHSSRSLLIVPGLSDPPTHGKVVTLWWTPAARYSGLTHDTHFDLLDINEVAIDAVERAGKLPPESFRAIERALEALGEP